jgi:hypothetical protein
VGASSVAGHNRAALEAATRPDPSARLLGGDAPLQLFAGFPPPSSWPSTLS